MKREAVSPSSRDRIVQWPAEGAGDPAPWRLSPCPHSLCGICPLGRRSARALMNQGTVAVPGQGQCKAPEDCPCALGGTHRRFSRRLQELATWLSGRLTVPEEAPDREYLHTPSVLQE